MRTEKEILESIENIMRMNVEMDEMSRLMLPLVELLLPVSREATTNGIPLEGRSITLSKVHFQKQYEKGINRAMGFDIVWQ